LLFTSLAQLPAHDFLNKGALSGMFEIQSDGGKVKATLPAALVAGQGVRSALP
jgi:hypothetical protein